MLTVQQGQRAELRCTATGNPAPSIEWTGNVLKNVVIYTMWICFSSIKLLYINICKSGNLRNPINSHSLVMGHFELKLPLGPGNRISSSATIQGGVLILPSVERSDEGEYTCRAFNTHGEHAARLVLYVQGTEQGTRLSALIHCLWIWPHARFLERSSHCTLSSVAGIVTRPRVIIQPPVITIQQGQRAEFRCTATGNPTPLVEWTGTTYDTKHI